MMGEKMKEVEANLSDVNESVKQEAADLQDSAESTAAKLRNRAGEVASSVESKAVQAVERTEEGLHEGRERVARSADAAIDNAGQKMEKTAERLRENADGGVKGRIARESADVLERSGHYLESTDLDDFKTDAADFVKKHPVPTVVAGLTLGYLVGKTIRR